MSKESPPEDNRRDSFRITDHAYIVYNLKAPPVKIASHKQPGGFSAIHETMTELFQHDRDLSRILSSVSEREQPLAGAFRILNRKLETLSRLVVLNQTDIADKSPQEVNLSLGGIAFQTLDALKKDTNNVHMQILLLPDLLPLVVKARVLDSEPCVGGFWTRFTFQKLTTEQQDMLARHILKAQQHIRRASRD